MQWAATDGDKLGGTPATAAAMGLHQLGTMQMLYIIYLPSSWYQNSEAPPILLRNPVVT